MGVWQIVWILFMTAGLAAAAIMHGKPKKGEYNFFAVLFSFAFELVLLILGGFFTA